MDQNKGCLKVCLVILCIILVFLLVSCSAALLIGGKNSSSPSNGMSYQYNNDSTYRKNVDDVSSVYGITPKEAEDTVERMLNGR